MKQKRPEIKVRFETFSALDRIKKAAKIEKRTVNQFVRIAAEEAAKKIISAELHSRAGGAAQGTEPDPMALNQ